MQIPRPNFSKYQRLAIDMSIYLDLSWHKPTHWRKFYRDLRTDINILKTAAITEAEKAFIEAFVRKMFHKQMIEVMTMLENGGPDGPESAHLLVSYFFDWAAYTKNAADYQDCIGFSNAWVTWLESQDNQLFITSGNVSFGRQFYSRPWFRILQVSGVIYNTEWLRTDTRQRAKNISLDGMQWLVKRRTPAMQSSPVRPVIEYMPTTTDGVAWWHHSASVLSGRAHQHGLFLQVQNDVLFDLWGTAFAEATDEYFAQMVDVTSRANAWVSDQSLAGVMQALKVNYDGSRREQPEGYPPYLLSISVSEPAFRVAVQRIAVQWRPGWFYRPTVAKLMDRFYGEQQPVSPVPTIPSPGKDDPDVKPVIDGIPDALAALDDTTRARVEQLFAAFYTDLIKLLNK
jgi:hypothetical protein